MEQKRVKLMRPFEKENSGDNKNCKHKIQKSSTHCNLLKFYIKVHNIFIFYFYYYS